VPLRLVAAHDRFLLNPPEKVRAAVEDKLRWGCT
jgi:hypothetical protein